MSVPVMRLDVVSEFPYKHSTGETIGRFLAGLKDQKTIWGQRVGGLGVVVPPLGYSEADGSAGGEWVAVKSTGTDSRFPHRAQRNTSWDAIRLGVFGPAASCS